MKKNIIIVVLAVLALLGCSSAIAGESSPSTDVSCEGYAGGYCGTVWWVEREGNRCAVAMDRSGAFGGIDCAWAREPE